MSKFEKLLKKILSLDNDLRFNELKKVLESYGYTMKETKGSSSHVTFRKKGRQSITIPRHGSIKIVYVEMVKEVVGSEERK